MQKIVVNFLLFLILVTPANLHASNGLSECFKSLAGTFIASLRLVSHRGLVLNGTNLEYEKLKLLEPYSAKDLDYLKETVGKLLEREDFINLIDEKIAKGNYFFLRDLVEHSLLVYYQNIPVEDKDYLRISHLIGEFNFSPVVISGLVANDLLKKEKIILRTQQTQKCMEIGPCYNSVKELFLDYESFSKEKFFELVKVPVKDSKIRDILFLYYSSWKIFRAGNLFDGSSQRIAVKMAETNDISYSSFKKSLHEYGDVSEFGNKIRKILSELKEKNVISQVEFGYYSYLFFREKLDTEKAYQIFYIDTLVRAFSIKKRVEDVFLDINPLDKLRGVTVFETTESGVTKEFELFDTEEEGDNLKNRLFELGRRMKRVKEIEKKVSGWYNFAVFGVSMVFIVASTLTFGIFYQDYLSTIKERSFWVDNPYLATNTYFVLSLLLSTYFMKKAMVSDQKNGLGGRFREYLLKKFSIPKKMVFTKRVLKLKDLSFRPSVELGELIESKFPVDVVVVDSPLELSSEKLKDFVKKKEELFVDQKK